MLGLTLIGSSRISNSLFILTVDLLDFIFSIDLLSHYFVGFHELVQFLSKLLVLHGNDTDVVLKGINFRLHFVVHFNLSVFDIHFGIAFLFQEAQLAFKFGELGLDVRYLFLHLHVFGRLLLDSVVEVLVLL